MSDDAVLAEGLDGGLSKLVCGRCKSLSLVVYCVLLVEFRSTSHV